MSPRRLCASSFPPAAARDVVLALTPAATPRRPPQTMTSATRPTPPWVWRVLAAGAQAARPRAAAPSAASARWQRHRRHPAAATPFMTAAAASRRRRWRNAWRCAQGGEWSHGGGHGILRLRPRPSLPQATTPARPYPTAPRAGRGQVGTHRRVGLAAEIGHTQAPASAWQTRRACRAIWVRGVDVTASACTVPRGGGQARGQHQAYPAKKLEQLPCHARGEGGGGRGSTTRGDTRTLHRSATGIPATGAGATALRARQRGAGAWKTPMSHGLPAAPIWPRARPAAAPCRHQPRQPR
ncbi:hypothetical protein BU14_0452s0009 [Porphyra umbilicalis]|uniref:Uncharacterized protein n=1 Tax=Porphyra umbilicalis TaxID=2786 RepID=A0A1X6NV68_PORUM|nr:hypothetical protein BU14_0452s0009 [Porphyra umbilicalis]|eukprot:OSX72263.1 hypothetical protein BU14_0452s0009 [Porphyra umbilicalis]